MPEINEHPQALDLSEIHFQNILNKPAILLIKNLKLCLSLKK